jgi:hypothetical protein
MLLRQTCLINHSICTLLFYSDHVELFNLLVGIIKEDDTAAYTACFSSRRLQLNLFSARRRR